MFDPLLLALDFLRMLLAAADRVVDHNPPVLEDVCRHLTNGRVAGQMVPGFVALGKSGLVEILRR